MIINLAKGNIRVALIIVFTIGIIFSQGCGKKEESKNKWKKYMGKTSVTREAPEPEENTSSKATEPSQRKNPFESDHLSKEVKKPFGVSSPENTATKKNSSPIKKKGKKKNVVDFDSIIKSLDEEEWNKKYAKLKEEEEFNQHKEKKKKKEEIEVLVVKLKAKKTKRLYGPFEIVNGKNIKLGNNIFVVTKAVTNKFGEQPHACLKSKKTGKISGPFLFVKDNIIEIEKSRFLVIDTEYRKAKSIPEEKLLYSFEKGVEGWRIPKWAFKDNFYVQKKIKISTKYAVEGKASLALYGVFPGKRETAVIVEVMKPFNWTDYDKIACDLFIPGNAPRGIKAQIVLTVSDKWKWVEMNKYVALVPGKWVTLSARLKPGTSDWKNTAIDDEFRKDVRKMAVRAICPTVYKGAVYIDNVRLLVNH